MSSSSMISTSGATKPSKLTKYMKHKKTNMDETLIMTFLVILLFIMIFTFITGHSHVQLDMISSKSKSFVKNKLEKLNVAKSYIIEDLKMFLHHNYEIIDTSKSTPKPSLPTDHRHAHPVSTSSSKADHDSSHVVPTSSKAITPPLSHKNLVLKHHHKLDCKDSELVTFWDEPSAADVAYQSPYTDTTARRKYVTFEPDVGGWNNIRMQMELVLVFAAATGRTLVLPPDQPMYLLNKGKGHEKAHSFADFFPFDHISQVLPVISMEEFMALEGITGHLFSNTNSQEVLYPPGNKTIFIGTDRDDRLKMWEYLRNVSSCPLWKSPQEFLIVPSHPMKLSSSIEGRNKTAIHFINQEKSIERYANFHSDRTAQMYDDYWHNQTFIHFISKPSLGLRLLQPFYTFIYFQDIHMQHRYARFIRDYVHYMDIIFCKAAIIVKSLMKETGGGNYSTLHIRRGEFQYSAVKLSAAKLLTNIGHLLPKHELLYIATDEKDKTFFHDFKTHGFTQLRFLDDYMIAAGLNHVNPNYLGMIEQVVCATGRIFVGTWFSTFSAYITRMRGYLGKHDYTVYYGDKEHRDRFHIAEHPHFPFYMREWNLSWVDIDDDDNGIDIDVGGL